MLGLDGKIMCVWFAVVFALIAAAVAYADVNNGWWVVWVLMSYCSNRFRIVQRYYPFTMKEGKPPFWEII